MEARLTRKFGSGSTLSVSYGSLTTTGRRPVAYKDPATLANPIRSGFW